CISSARVTTTICTPSLHAALPIFPPWMEADPLIQDRAKRMITSYNKETGKLAIEGSEWLYNQFGIDVSPERMGYLIRQYSGGPGDGKSTRLNSGHVKMTYSVF